MGPAERPPAEPLADAISSSLEDAPSAERMRDARSASSNTPMSFGQSQRDGNFTKAGVGELEHQIQDSFMRGAVELGPDLGKDVFGSPGMNTG